jgi:hypothetical protein
MMHRDKVAQSNEEISNLRLFVEQTKDIDGDVAEVGVYEGGTASVIYDAMNPNKHLYLFDSFESGFVGAGEYDPEWIRSLQGAGNLGTFSPLNTSYSEIVKYFQRHSNVTITKGSFPQSENGLLKDKKFSFVHLDVDIYLPTKESLEFFYPKMSKGGVIISHDYFHSNLQGVKKAMDDFFADKPEKIISNPNSFMSQGYIIKQ